VFTDADLSNPTILRDVQDATKYLKARLEAALSASPQTARDGRLLRNDDTSQHTSSDGPQFNDDLDCNHQVHKPLLAIDLVLEIDNDVPDTCQYYFADHENQTIFWLEAFDQDQCESFKDVRDAKNASHIREKFHDNFLIRLAHILMYFFLEHFFKAQYWKHLELYPATKLPDSVYSELQNMLAYLTLGRFV
jgi:hypothetical protein